MVVYIELDLIFCWLGISRQKVVVVKTKHKHDSWFFLNPHMSQYYYLQLVSVNIRNIFDELLTSSLLPALQFRSPHDKTSNLRHGRPESVSKQTMLLQWISPVSRVLLKPQWQARVGTASVISDRFVQKAHHSLMEFYKWRTPFQLSRWLLRLISELKATFRMIQRY